MAAILEFYIRFWYWCMYSRPYLILHLLAKFRKFSDDRRRIYDVISVFFNGGHRVGNVLPGWGL